MNKIALKLGFFQRLLVNSLFKRIVQCTICGLWITKDEERGLLATPHSTFSNRNPGTLEIFLFCKTCFDAISLKIELLR